MTLFAISTVSASMRCTVSRCSATIVASCVNICPSSAIVDSIDSIAVDRDWIYVSFNRESQSQGVPGAASIFPEAHLLFHDLHLHEGVSAVLSRAFFGCANVECEDVAILDGAPFAFGVLPCGVPLWCEEQRIWAWG